MDTLKHTTDICATEQWICVPSFPLLDASSHGRLRRRFANGNIRIIQGVVHRSGYLRTMIAVNGKPRQLRLHRLIAEAFHGPCPPRHEVNHKDGNKRNNAPANLEYVTHRDNIRHAWRLGLASPNLPDGFCEPRRLTDADVAFITSHLGTMSLSEIGQRVGVSSTMIWKIKRGYRHKQSCPSAKGLAI